MTRATKQEISAWFDGGVADGAAYLLVVCDEFDMDDYPVYVTASEDPVEMVADYAGKSMSRVMEAYDLSLDRDAQLAEERSWHLVGEPIKVGAVSLSIDKPCPSRCDHDLSHGLCFLHGSMKWVGRNCECPPRRTESHLAESSRIEREADVMLSLTVPHMVTVVLTMTEKDARALSVDLRAAADGFGREESYVKISAGDDYRDYSADVVKVTELPEPLDG